MDREYSSELETSQLAYTFQAISFLSQCTIIMALQRETAPRVTMISYTQVGTGSLREVHSAYGDQDRVRPPGPDRLVRHNTGRDKDSSYANECRCRYLAYRE